MFNVKKSFSLFEVDFHKPWWHILLKHKFVFGLEVFNELIQAVFGSLTPLIIGFALTSRNYNILIWFGIIYILLEVFNRYVITIFWTDLISTRSSLGNQAYKHFLTVDPLYHTTKSSGQIISKIQGTTEDVHNILNILAANILPTMFSFVATVITLASFNASLGLIGVVSFFVICISNGLVNYINAKSFAKKRIHERDEVGKITVENLSQNALIRSSFATPEQISKTTAAITKHSIVAASSSMAFGLTTTITRTLYIISTLSIATVIFVQVNNNQLDQYLGITLIITYINGSSQILRLGTIISDFVEKVTGIQDTFDFIRNFGKQTFPVVEIKE